MHFSIDRTVHTTAFDKPVVDHWLERKIAQTAARSTEKDRSDDRPLQRRARYRLSYIPLPPRTCVCFYMSICVAMRLVHISMILNTLRVSMYSLSFKNWTNPWIHLKNKITRILKWQKIGVLTANGFQTSVLIAWPNWNKIFYFIQILP